MDEDGHESSVVHAHATVGLRLVGVFRFRSHGAATLARKKTSCTKMNSVKSWQRADIKTSWGRDEDSL
jgi:hypothetical protein